MLVAAAGLALIVAAQFWYGHIGMGHDWGSYPGGWTRVLWGFFLGVLLYRLWSTQPPRALPSAAFAAVCLGFVAVSAVPVPGPVYELAVAMVLFPAVVFWGAGIRISGAARTVAVQLGHFSYAIYITHMLLMEVMRALARWQGIELAAHRPAAMLVCSALAIGIAWLLDRWFDRPVRAWLGARLLAPEARAALAMRAVEDAPRRAA